MPVVYGSEIDSSITFHGITCEYSGYVTSIKYLAVFFLLAHLLLYVEPETIELYIDLKTTQRIPRENLSRKCGNNPNTIY
jgi:hypothetical protein